MKKIWYLAAFLFGMYSASHAVYTKYDKPYKIMHNKKTYRLHQKSLHLGQLHDRTWVKMVCIKPGMMGMPNIATPDFRGKFKNRSGETCYLFVKQPEATITFEEKEYQIYKDGDIAFLHNGAEVRIECYPAGVAMRLPYDPNYRGAYTDSQGKKCLVYMKELLARPA